MLAVEKYAVRSGELSVDLRHGAKIIHFAEQRGRLYIWALGDPRHSREPRRIIIALTQQVINPPETPDGTELQHRGTFDAFGCEHHLFEVVPL